MPTKFIAAMKHFFGFLPNQTLSGFREEITALSAEEREEFKAMLGTVGYEIEN